MLIDGWKNENANTKNVTVMLRTTSSAVFLDNWELSLEKETGEKLAEIIQITTELALEKYDTKIYAVISDNAANMMKMGTLTNIWHLTCNSHTAQLLAEDVTPISVVNKVTSILKQFNGPGMEKRILNYGGSRIQLPSTTRWCSNRDSMGCFLKNLPHMKKILSEDGQNNSGWASNHNIPGATAALLFDQSFLKSVQDTVDLLDPVRILKQTLRQQPKNG